MLLARTFFPLSLASADGARMAQAELVSGNYFDTLRAGPFVGRFFDEGVDREGSAPLAVLSHRLWQLRFAAQRRRRRADSTSQRPAGGDCRRGATWLRRCDAAHRG